MPYRNKVYVCFDGDKDIHYYRLMQAWHQSDHTSFNFYDAHQLNQARDTSTEASNTREFIVLIGESTRYLTKFVKWEMEQALALNLPIIAVNLNGLRQQDPDRCPPTIRDALAIHVSFNAKIIQYALENWPELAQRLERQREISPRYFTQGVYRQLGL
jgi:hypothetical protein